MPPDRYSDIILEIEDLAVALQGEYILKNVQLKVHKDEIFGIVGKSGCGKTTLLRCILLLQRISHGSVRLFNQSLQASESQTLKIKRRWGVMFQHGALFSSLTVLENVLFPLRTQTELPPELQNEIAYLKIAQTGLPLSAAHKFPSQLSGGMQKRAALARAIVLDPEILFLDEPTSGLDSHSAEQLDRLILDLRKSLNLTIIVVTHDLDILWQVTDRVAFLGEGTILATLPMEKLTKFDQPSVNEYFSGLRAQRANKLAAKERQENNEDKE